jgi:hypothetical protein
MKEIKVDGTRVSFADALLDRRPEGGLCIQRAVYVQYSCEDSVNNRTHAAQSSVFRELRSQCFQGARKQVFELPFRL